MYFLQICFFILGNTLRSHTHTHSLTHIVLLRNTKCRTCFLFAETLFVCIHTHTHALTLTHTWMVTLLKMHLNTLEFIYPQNCVVRLLLIVLGIILVVCLCADFVFVALSQAGLSRLARCHVIDNSP